MNDSQQDNTSLIIQKIASNEIEDAHVNFATTTMDNPVSSFLEALQKNTSLKSITLVFPELDKKVMDSLIEAIHPHKHIEDITVEFLAVPEKAANYLLHCQLMLALGGISRDVRILPKEALETPHEQKEDVTSGTELSEAKTIDQLYEEIQAIPGENGRKAELFVEAMNLKIKADRAAVKSISPDAKYADAYIDAFCEESGIPKESALSISEKINRYSKYITIPDMALSSANTKLSRQLEPRPPERPKKSRRKTLNKDFPFNDNRPYSKNFRQITEDNWSFSLEDAVKLIAGAFGEYDDHMKEIVWETYRQGRISTLPWRGGAAHTMFNGLGYDAPKDIRQLDKEYRRQPCISAPFPEEIAKRNTTAGKTLPGASRKYSHKSKAIPEEEKRYSIRELFYLAHEFGHLISFQRYQEAGQTYAETDTSLQETYSTLCERIMYDYMMEKEKDNPVRNIIIRDMYRESIDANFTSSAKRLAFRQALEEELDGIGQDVKPGVGEFVQAMHRVPIKAGGIYGNLNSFLFHSPLHPLCYVYGLMASGEILRRHKAGEQNLVQSLSELHQKGMKLTFAEAMEHLGIKFSDFDLLYNNVRADYENTKKTLAVAIKNTNPDDIARGR